ncbi:MAG: BatD family protein [bacterium]
MTTAAAAAPGPAVEVRATVTPSRAKVGDRIDLTVNVRIRSEVRTRGFFSFGSNPRYDYSHPGLQDFEITNQGASQRTELIGTRQTYTRTTQYIISPRRVGTLTIEPAQIIYQGKAYRSNRLTVAVGAIPAPPPTRPGQVPNLDGTEQIFVQVVPDKLKAYVGEQVTITWYLYSKTDMAAQHNAVKTTATTDSFFSEEIPFRSKLITHQTIKNQVYTVKPIARRALFPLKSGRLRVGALSVEAFIDYYTKMVRSSAEVFIESVPLPTTNVPPGFHAKNVGTFRVTADVDSPTVDARSATAFKVIVQGSGFLHGLKVDKLKQLDGFKVRFAGQKTEMASTVQLSGKHILEYVLIPARVGTLTVPPICFPHFNPHASRFVTACSRALKITVTGSLPSGAGGLATAGRDNELRRRLKPILQGSQLRDRKVWRLHRVRWLLWPVLLLPVMAVFGLVLVRQIRSTLDRDTEARRRRQARGHARRRLRLAASYLKNSDHVGFFTEIANVIHELLSARLGARIQGLTAVELKDQLEHCSMPSALQERILSDLEVCDFARFAPAAAQEQEMLDVLQRTRKLISDIERAKLLRATQATDAVDREVSA